jgi:hypothetical protein
MSTYREYNAMDGITMPLHGDTEILSSLTQFPTQLIVSKNLGRRVICELFEHRVVNKACVSALVIWAIVDLKAGRGLDRYLFFLRSRIEITVEQLNTFYLGFTEIKYHAMQQHNAAKRRF